MPKFENKYLHFMWSDKLEGKTVFFADELTYLLDVVENNTISSMGVVTYSGDDSEPFKRKQHCDTQWRFVYFDPYYDMKIALEQGKTIQGKHRLTGEWVDMAGKNIDWDNVDGYELRIKPDEPEESKPVTNCELAKWLAQGNGEFLLPEFNRCCYEFRYDFGKENEPVNSKYLVRKWGDSEWVIPSREYMGLD